MKGEVFKILYNVMFQNIKTPLNLIALPAWSAISLLFKGKKIHCHSALVGLRRLLMWWTLHQNAQTEV